MSPKSLSALLKPYNQTRVAEFVGVSRSTVHSWARGETFPAAEKLPRLAEILRIDAGDLAAIISLSVQTRRTEAVA